MSDHRAYLNATRPEVALRRFSKLICFSTLLLIFIGGMVTSTNSGLSVPDWPTTYGYSMFSFPLSKMVGGIYYEHGHRMIAAVVGFLTLVLAFWTPWVDQRKWIRFLGFAALSAVILQGILGGLTVLLKLPPIVSVAHGVLAQTFFVITIIFAYGLSVERRRRLFEEQLPPASAALIKCSFAIAALVFIQLILGAIMRHTHAGLAIPDFPRMAGSFSPLFNSETLARINQMRHDLQLPPVTLPQVWIHFTHRLGATLVTLAIILFNIIAYRRRPTFSKVMLTLQMLDLLLIIQWMLAMFTIWTHKAPIMTSLHVVTGAAILGISMLLLLRCCPVKTAKQYKEAFLKGAATANPLQQQAMSLVAAIRPYLELAKPRIVTMVLVTTTIGYFLGSNGSFHIALLVATLIGTGLAAAGSAVLNNYLERDTDAKMLRTQHRALPSGRIEPAVALAYGILLVLGGVGLLVWSVNLLSGFLVLLTAFLYVLVYTPLKKMTWLNTPIGAIPGALPPMVGWAAAQGHLDLGAWLLFAILFAWQHPHFYSIAWLFKEDYRRAGFKMLSVVDATDRRLFIQSIAFTLLLIAVSLLLPLGKIYFYGSILIGLMMLAASLAFSRSHTGHAARRVLLTSIIYLPLLLLLIIIDTGLTHYFPTLGK